MENIPDCYDPAYQADLLAERAERNAVRCELCSEVITDDVFLWDGMGICEDCCVQAIKDNFNVREFADAFKIPVLRPCDL